MARLYILKMSFFCSSADVNPEHHVKILEALIMVGGLVEIQAAPGRTTEVLIILSNFCRFIFLDDFFICVLCIFNTLIVSLQHHPMLPFENPVGFYVPFISVSLALIANLLIIKNYHNYL